jgi:heparan-alpha-glucosaminide N-acetyltransferase
LRVRSVDVLRGLTILLMIFVNDIAGVAGTPAWLKHFAPADGNGMTIVDVVFPAFLFIVGLAVPLSLEARQHRDETAGQMVFHVLTRSLSLLIIGVLMVNSDVISQHGIIDPNLWTLLTYFGIFLFWVRWPGRDPAHEKVQRLLQLAGALLLASSMPWAWPWRGGCCTCRTRPTRF